MKKIKIRTTFEGLHDYKTLCWVVSAQSDLVKDLQKLSTVKVGYCEKTTTKMIVKQVAEHFKQLFLKHHFSQHLKNLLFE